MIQKKKNIDYIKTIDKNILEDIFYLIESDYSGHKNFKDFVKCVIDINLTFFKFFEKRMKKKDKDKDYNEILDYYNKKIKNLI